MHSLHTAMERKTLNIKWQDHISNQTVKEKSKLPELLTTITKQKWKWAGHAARMTSQCGNPAKENEIEADPKNAGLKGSASISAK